MHHRTLELTVAQRAELEHTRDRDHRAYLREIAAALLKIADGMAPYAVALHGLHKRRKPATVYRWLNVYQQRGLSGLVHRPRGHRGFPPQQAEDLRETLRQPPSQCGMERPRWRLRDLRDALPWLASYSLAGLSQALRRLGIRRSRGRLSIHSPDPAYQTKLAWITQARALAVADPEHVRVCYGDEFSLYRQPTLGPVYAPCGWEPTAPLSYRQNGWQRYSGALDVRTGQVTATTASRMGAKELARFLRKLRQTYPTEELFLIWDNWPVHQHPTVLAAAAEAEIALLWLPTYAPWTNPIEQLWRWIRQDVVHHHRRADAWPALQQQVLTFLERFEHGSDGLLRYVGLLAG